jgi:hypothetical protein
VSVPLGVLVLLAAASPATPTAKARPAEAEVRSEALIVRALALREAGNEEEAFGLLERAYELSPNPRAAAQLGTCEQALGRPDSPDHGSVAGSSVCIPASSGTYRFYTDYFIPPNQGIAGDADVEVTLFSTADCGDFLVNLDTEPLGNTTNRWSRASLTFMATSGTRSISIRLNSLKWKGAVDFVVHFDNVLLVR